MSSLSKHQWAGKRAILVGGGPSLKTFDFSLLYDEPRVIVVNRAFIDVPTAAVFFTEDLRVIELYQKPLADFKGIKVFHALDPVQRERALALDPSLFIIDRKREDKFWSTSFEEGLSYSSNSMIGALNIADILGADPIYLLGVDCNKKGGYITNYHDDYVGKFDQPGDHQFDSFVSDFKHWAALHLKHRTIVNLNESSAVECWPKINWKHFFRVVPLER